MVSSRFFDWFPFVILLAWGTVGLTRAVAQRARGTRVFAADRGRSPGEKLADGLAALCLLIWSWEVVAVAWSLNLHIGPVERLHSAWDGTLFRWIGVVLGVLGVLVYAVALRDLGASWRLGIDKAAPGPLVTAGIYRWTRHPIYVAFDLIFLGTFLAQGRVIFLALTLVWLPLMHALMLREERFLERIYGDTYRDYCARVGRYGPRTPRGRR